MRLASPMRHPVIRKTRQFVLTNLKGTRPTLLKRLRQVTHQFCRDADADHAGDSRTYAHTWAHGDDDLSICWARAFAELSDDQICGICLHEYGHILAGPMRDASDFDAELGADVAILKGYGVEIAYCGDEMIQEVDYNRILRGC